MFQVVHVAGKQRRRPRALPDHKPHLVDKFVSQKCGLRNSHNKSIAETPEEPS